MLLVEAVGCHLFVEGFDFSSLVADGGQQRVELLVVDGGGVLLLHAHQEVGEHVHIVGERCERCLVGRESGVRRSVGEVLGRHVEQMVRRLQAPPVLFELAVVAEAHALGYGVELVESLLLQLVAEPCRGVARFVGPRHGEGHGDFSHRLEGLHGLGRCHEAHAALCRETGKRFEKLEYA